VRGRPLLPKIERERCEAQTIETHWKRDRKLDLRCPFFATLMIGEKRLCDKHAKMEALSICIEKGICAVLPPPPQARVKYQRVPLVEPKRRQ